MNLYKRSTILTFCMCLGCLLVGCGEIMEEVLVLETDQGEIVLAFLPEKAPGHVDNMKKLAGDGFYDGTKFHRVIPNFMIQGGDPNTKGSDPSTWGTGDPGYKIPAEFNDTLHLRGVLSMARSAAPNSAGSQFFICHAKAAHLDGQYTAFGFVISGLDVVDKIVTTETHPNSDRPVEPPVLVRAYLKEIPADEVVPENEAFQP